jgi:large subunit ribosomal protein L35
LIIARTITGPDFHSPACQHDRPGGAAQGDGSVAKTKVKKYKLKTHKATAKRFRATGSGLLVRTRGPKSHLRRKKSKRASAELSHMVTVKGVASVRRVMRLAPYIRKFRANPPGG